MQIWEVKMGSGNGACGMYMGSGNWVLDSRVWSLECRFQMPESGVWNALAASLRVAILLMLVVAPRSAVVASEVTTPSGLRIIDDKPDTGPVPTFM